MQDQIHTQSADAVLSNNVPLMVRNRAREETHDGSDPDPGGSQMTAVVPCSTLLNSSILPP